MKKVKKDVKKVAAKQPVTKAAEKAEKNQWGFRSGTASDEAIRLIAGGKIGEARKEFGKNLSFGKLFKDLSKRGFSVKVDKEGTSSIVAKAKASK